MNQEHPRNLRLGLLQHWSLGATVAPWLGLAARSRAGTDLVSWRTGPGDIGWAPLPPKARDPRPGERTKGPGKRTRWTNSARTTRGKRADWLRPGNVPRRPCNAPRIAWGLRFPQDRHLYGIVRRHFRMARWPAQAYDGSVMNASCRALPAVLIFCCLASCQTPPQDSETRPAGANVLKEAELAKALKGKVRFDRHVKPVLEAKCLACHQVEAMPGRLSLESRSAALRSGTLGTFIVPGRPQDSRFLHNVTKAHWQAMPPVGETLTHEEKVLLERWIAQGAEWPDGDSGRLRTPF